MGATGTAVIDFGAFPGVSDASVAVTGQAAIVAGSLVEAWIRPEATADHTDTEHMVETLKVIAANIVAGTGFTIYGFNTSQINTPADPLPPRTSMQAGATATTVAFAVKEPPPGRGTLTPQGTRLYGLWTVAWAWN